MSFWTKMQTSIFGSFLLLIGLPTTSYCQAKPTIEDIAKAWKVRSEKVTSFHFKWNEQQTDTKGCISTMLAPLLAAMKSKKKNGIVPPETTTYTVKNSLWVKSKSIRFAYDTQYWSTVHKRYEPAHYASVFDGKAGKTLLKDGVPDARWPQGTIRSEAHHLDVTVPHLRPIIMTYRAAVPEMTSYPLETFRLTNRKIMIDGTICFELYRQWTKDTENRLFVDPAKGYIIRRIVTQRNKIVTESIDVKYKADPKAGWIPSEWTIFQNYPDGQLKNSFIGKVTSFEINSRMAASTFSLDFPDGTRVSDLRNHTDYIHRKVRKTGSK